MSKVTVTALFIGASVAVVAGSLIAIGAVLSGIAGGVIALGGAQVITVNGAAFAGMLPWLLVASVLTGAGAVAGLGSWIAALFNTSQLEDRTWFVALLVLGLFSLGWIAMIAYVVAGPDGTSPRQAPSGAIASVAL